VNHADAREIVHQVVEDVNRFTGLMPQSDDITMLMLKYLG
jgi:serine phosphatase RsbU (regulator of sigma subunit)